ncbi:hypothetical protein [Crocosphaera chwakensis]|uniref:hypothetical protein n=1 Tax=Crocosphaera chwakensis TaxID=2546361 RepID=UPI000903C9F5|nr:hypothetical protein [Crocosphaera chwakensis]
MSKSRDPLDPIVRQEWLSKIEQANRNNILCHCRLCGWEWVDSSFEVQCRCGSTNVETISCWQFPDG